MCVFEPERSCLLETVGSGNQRQNLDSDQEEAANCCKEAGKPGSLEVLEEVRKPKGVGSSREGGVDGLDPRKSVEEFQRR